MQDVQPVVAAYKFARKRMDLVYSQEEKDEEEVLLQEKDKSNGFLSRLKSTVTSKVSEALSIISPPRGSTPSAPSDVNVGVGGTDTRRIVMSMNLFLHRQLIAVNGQSI